MQFANATEYAAHLAELIDDPNLIRAAVARKFKTPGPVSQRKFAERSYPKPSNDDLDWVDPAPSDRAFASMMALGNERFLKALLPEKLAFLRRYQGKVLIG